LKALEKHVKICKDIFQGKRKKFNMSYYRNKELLKYKLNQNKDEQYLTGAG